MRRFILLLLLSSSVPLVRGIGQSAAKPAGLNAEPFMFKGNSLGMTLDAFKASNNQGKVWVASGAPNWRGKPRKGMEREVPTPLCTDEMRGFPGDNETLAMVPDEVFCNPAPAEINPEARMVAGNPVAQYPIIKSAFQTKYGPAPSRSEVGFQNGFGARWTGEVLLWNRSTQTLMLYEGGKNGPGQDEFDPVGSSSATFTDGALAPHLAPAQKPDF